MKYEYIRIRFDFGDLSELNQYSQDGWRVVAVVQAGKFEYPHELPYWALLERVLDC